MSQSFGVCLESGYLDGGSRDRWSKNPLSAWEPNKRAESPLQLPIERSYYGGHFWQFP
jgi:hypothetical protein